MSYIVGRLNHVDADLVSSVSELLRATSRRLILATGAIYLVWQVFVADALAGRPGFLIAPAGAVLIAAGLLSLLLLPRWLGLAQAVWQIGLAAAITLSLRASGLPAVGFLYALLPLMATVTLGWPAGLLVEALMSGLVLWVGRSGATPLLSAGVVAGIITGGALTWVVGWTSISALVTATSWSLVAYEQARLKMEEAREQGMELKQAQEDLVLANRELARLSERLRWMHQVAEQARRAKEEFVANVSHELRTPLNMIIGFSEVITHSPLVYGDRLPPALLADITAIQRNSQHLARLVNDVLDLSQVEAGRMALSRSWNSLAGILQEAQEIVQPLFQSKGLYLEAAIPDDLPRLFCDSTRIRQVVVNLLSNAGRFTERGGVRISAGCEGGQVVVAVADTGPGISEEDQKRLFEPFQQLGGSLSCSHGGSGLGLSISKRFVELHGGRMWLESCLGHGTTVRFALPLDEPEPAAAQAGSQASRWFHSYSDYEYQARTRRSKAPMPAVPARYVLLEQDGTLQRLFGGYADDAEIVAVPSLEQAIEELRRSPARALVVNASPLDESPVQARCMGDIPFVTPVVQCWVPGEAEAAARLGVVRYLTKPVTREALLAALDEQGDAVRTILLVDDQPEVLQLFSRLLTSAGRDYDVICAKNGQRALSIMRREHPDIVLLDLMMPGMDGFQVLECKGQDPDLRPIPVIVISARDPVGEPIVSDMLTIRRSGGLSVRDLLRCVRAVSDALLPSALSGDRAQSETAAA